MNAVKRRRPGLAYSCPRVIGVKSRKGIPYTRAQRKGSVSPMGRSLVKDMVIDRSAPQARQRRTSQHFISTSDRTAESTSVGRGTAAASAGLARRREEDSRPSGCSGQRSESHCASAAPSADGASSGDEMTAGSQSAQERMYWERWRGGRTGSAAPGAAVASLRASRRTASHGRMPTPSVWIEAATYNQHLVECRDWQATSAGMRDVRRPPSGDGMDKTTHHRQTRSSSPLRAAGCTRRARCSPESLWDSAELCTVGAHSATRSADPDGCDRGGRDCARRRSEGSGVHCSSGSPCWNSIGCLMEVL